MMHIKTELTAIGAALALVAIPLQGLKRYKLQFPTQHKVHLLCLCVVNVLCIPVPQHYRHLRFLSFPEICACRLLMCHNRVQEIMKVPIECWSLFMEDEIHLVEMKLQQYKARIL